MDQYFQLILTYRCSFYALLWPKKCNIWEEKEHALISLAAMLLLYTHCHGGVDTVAMSVT